eukprot:7420785-Ditylum_brightwellii.AAC.1
MHLITPARAYLHINGMPIMKDYHNKIIQALPAQDLREYITEKFEWKSNTSDLVEWKLSGNLYSNKKFSEKPFITRYAHKIPPFLALKSTVAPTKTCTCCRATNVTPQHFPHCHTNKEAQAEFYISMIPKLNKYKIDPALRILLHIECMNNTITTTKNTQRDIDWRLYMKLIHHQGEIRWMQVLYGRFASEWVNAQHRCKYNSKRGYNNNPKWLRWMIHEIWTFAAKRWTNRNKTLVINTTDETRPYRLQKEVLLYQIRGLYAKQNNMMEIDCMTFQQALSEWKQCSQSQMMQWLAPFQPYIKYCTTVHKPQTQNKLQDIRHYFK